ncbi:PH domain-containing protein [Rhizobium sp. MHM7A]|uniref:PH domain-containing protein n=1 Tax=Rhizobium sp. MHM7A TaxID=2583233 RepID=UPI001105B14A|nr:PH domain-containing protein [Rhizobium sp. MHM7A]TLX16795.1 PH domain-containing protein [Rhizobium sp. MHM7A]
MNKRNSAAETERSLWTGSPSKRVAIVFPLVCVCAIVAGFIYYPEIQEIAARIAAQLSGHYAPWMDYSAYILAAIFILPGVWSFLGQVTTNYECTSERLIIRKGILVRTEDEVELYRVVDVLQSANVLQMLVGVGTVFVKSTDQTGNVAIASVTQSARVRNVIRTASEECKTRRGTLRVLNEAAGVF